MFNRYKRGKMSYGLVGLGRFGYALASELAAMEADLLILDKNEEKVREIREYTENALVIKNLDKASLLETGIQNCDVAVVCIGEQMDTSILTTLNLVGMGIPRVIARATSSEHGEILEKLGAQVVYPEHDMAARLANRLEAANLPNFAQLSDRISISKLNISYEMEDETVAETDLKGRFGVNVIAIESSGVVYKDVDPDYEFKEGDIIFVIGDKDNIKELTEWIEDD